MTSPPFIRRRRRAFTLIELLVASVLAAVLIGGVLVAADALGRDARRRGAVADPSQRFDAAIDLIRRDLANARSVEWHPDGSVSLIGHGAIDPRDGTSTGRLAGVEYAVAGGGPLRGGKAAGGFVLVREQRLLDGGRSEPPWRELVAARVEGFQLSPLYPSPRVAVERAGPSAPPSRVRIRFETADGAFERAVQVR